MANNSSIEWTEATWNLAPLKRKKPTTYFVNSMGDLFHEDCPDEWIDKVFAVMALAPQHTFQVLTKRAGRLRKFFERLQSCRPREDLVACEMARLQGKPDLDRPSFNFPLPNVWLGVSTERQQEADERIPLLLQTPAAVRFISAEPLLGPIDLTKIPFVEDHPAQVLHVNINALTAGSKSAEPWHLNWVIAGGESGPNARPTHPDWVRSLRDQCKAADVAFFFKQWGEWRQRDCVHVSRDHAVFNEDGSLTMGVGAGTAVDCLRTHVVMERMGKKAAGRLLDGVLHDAMPERRSI